MSTHQQSRGLHRAMSNPPEDTPPEPLSNDVGSKKPKRRISMLPKIGGGSNKSPSKLSSSSSKGRRRRPTLDRDNSAVAMGKLTNDPREEMMMNTDDTVDINNSGHKKRSKEKAGSSKGGRDKGGDNRANMMRDMQQNSKYY